MSGHFIAIAAWAALQATEPAPDCVAPSPPERLFAEAPVRPPMPSCVNERTNRHTCSNRVISAYNQEIEAYEVEFNAYVDRINAYISALNDYVTAVTVYTQCENRRVAPNALIVG